MRSFGNPLIRLCLVLIVATSVVALAVPRSAVAQGSLPVPREQTIFLEDTAAYAVFDSFHVRIPNGNEFAQGFYQIGNEYLFLGNFATGQIEPWLAKSYEYNKEYTEMTIHLRDDVHWQDGKPFTSDDVIF